MRLRLICCSMAICTAVLGCKSKKEDPPPARELSAPSAAALVIPDHAPYEVTRFGGAGEAFAFLLKKTSPLMVGIGEIHQNEDTVQTRSALVRFTEDMLPSAADQTADLVVETWVSTGRCGEVEKKVTKEVDEVIERPAATEDETLRLLKAAAARNIKPHVLEMSCDDYRRIYEADGGTDYFLLLQTVGERLGHKATAVRAARQKDGEAAKPLTLIYGGGLHNDLTPPEMWAAVTFGPATAAVVGKERYLELDLVVPEFAAASKVLQQEPWMPAVQAAAAPDSVALIRLDERSYILVFASGVKAGPLHQSP